jgi:nitroimidazol reductase NimA-like FMN-containing flavoprotein (pyridoxamine 5'-phosphate oxidase superfamily)
MTSPKGKLTMPEFTIDDRNEVKRIPSRAFYDKETIHQIIDQALICYVSFVEEEQPFIIPCNFARIENNIILHGSNDSRMIKNLQAGKEICITMTLLDGLVLARSACSHGVNYRAVVLFGRGVAITEDKEKFEALKAVSEHLLPGRWKEIRKPTKEELENTAVVSIPIESASAKVMIGHPKDDPADLDLPVWAGLVPIKLQAMQPEPDPERKSDIPIPDYVTNFLR